MSNYTRSTNFTAKDALASGNPSKIVLGSEHDTEYDAIAVAIATKLDSIETLSAETSLATGDSIPLYDTSATTNKRITVSNARLALSSWTETGFYASSSATTSCADNTYTRIALGTEVYDPGNLFSSNYYATPTTGLYLFFGCVQIAISSAIGTTVAGGLQIADSGGVTLSSVNFDTAITTVASNPGPGGLMIVSLTAGQRVYLTGFQNNGGARNAAAGGACYLGGWRIS